MGFVALTATEIETGKPVANTTWTKTKDNFDNLDARATALEGGATTVYPPIIFRVNGNYSGCVYENILKTTLNFNITITGIRILIDSCGFSGTTEITMKWKRAAGAWTSLLTTNPSVAYTAGSDALSTNAVLNSSNVNLLAGDILRLDMVSTQAKGRGFLVRVDYNKT